MDVITIGKAMRDIVFQIDKPLAEIDPKREKIVVQNCYPSIGGGAVNTAVSLTKLGLKTAPIAVIGDDPEGKEISKELTRRGVETELLIQNPDLPSGTSVIVGDKDKHHRIYVYPGVNKYLDLDMFQWSTMGDASYWYLLSVGNPDTALLNEVAKQKEKAGVRLAFNPGQMQLKAGNEELTKIFQATDILFVNQKEAEQLTGQKGDDLFKALVNLGPKIVAITFGPDGAGCYGGKEIFKSKAFPGERVNAVGAGDAFGSAFLAGFQKTGKLEVALKWGLANSASAVTQYGAQKGLLTKGELLKVVKDTKVEIEKQ